MGATVTVACKLPHGLDLGLDHTIDAGIDHKRNGEMVVRQPGGKRIVLAGANSPNAVAGYGMTPGVDAEFWNHWREANKDFPPVKNGLIFAHDREAMVAGQAAEQQHLRSGFEPLNTEPGKDPRMPRPGAGVEFQPTDETKRAIAKGKVD